MKNILQLTTALFIAITVFGSTAFSARDLFVGPLGSDRNDGSSRTEAWGSLSHAFGNLRPGDTLTLLPGDYVVRDSPGHDNGRIDVHRTNGGTVRGNSTSWTVIRAEQKDTVNITGNIIFEGAYIRFEKLNIVGDAQNDFPGIFGLNSDHIDVYDCEVSHCGGGGINFNHSDSLRISGNSTHDNGARNRDQHSGISVYQPIRVADAENRYWSIRITNNYSYNNRNEAEGDYGITDGNGIILDDTMYTQSTWLSDANRVLIGNARRYPGRTLIEGNMCNYNGGSGVQVFYSAKATIKNNTCFGNRQYAFNRDGTYSNHGQIAITNSDANHILNNVLVSDWVGVASGSGGAPFAASEFGNGINLWQTNLLHTKIANSPLTNSENIEADSVIADPQFADEASYDYRSVAGRNMGSRWNGHVYFDIRNVMVGPGQRVDLGCIQNP